MQKLIYPFRQARMICGYKNPCYHYGDSQYKGWGYDHYGVDISALQDNAKADDRIYASGEGLVLKAGWDNSGGNILIILYNNVYNHRTGKVQDVVARYYHLRESIVKVGAKVTKNTVIGFEGNTKTTQPHLHLEFDADTEHPEYSPQVSKRDDYMTEEQGNRLLQGWRDDRDTTINPSFILFQTPERKVIPSSPIDQWINREDREIPMLDNTDIEKEYQQALKELAKARAIPAALIADIRNVLKKYEE